MSEGLSAEQISLAGARIQARVESLRMLVLAIGGLTLLLWLVLQVEAPKPEPDGPTLAPTPAVTFPALPDFAAIDDVTVKKRRFFSYLLPMVEARNAEIRRTRAFLRETRASMASRNSSSSGPLAGTPSSGTSISATRQKFSCRCGSRLPN